MCCEKTNGGVFDGKTRKARGKSRGFVLPRNQGQNVTEVGKSDGL